MHKNAPYLIVLILLLGAGLLVTYQLINSNRNLELQEIEAQLQKTHSDAIIRAKAGVEVYATIVSSIKSFTKNTEQFPTEVQLQSYLKDLLNEIKFQDSIVVNYIDIHHVFKYVVTPNKIDAPSLKGVSVKNLISPSRLIEMELLMLGDEIALFSPVNLREGFTGFPFNFSARSNDNKILGYITPILDVKYLLDYFYDDSSENEYVHKFIINDSLDLTREAFYNGSKIFNINRDSEYYKNFKDVKEENFIYSNLELFGLKMKVGSAYKRQPEINTAISILGYTWYGLIALLTVIVFNQFIKNKELNKKLITTNKDLEHNLSKIQTLIKEIHHRVKNNMQMISGILSFQEDEHEDEKVVAALNQSKSRIQSMSLLHQKLYGSITLEDIKLKEYVEELIEYVEQTVSSEKIRLHKTVSINSEYVLDGGTMSNLGLIINELITNSFKHAFGLGKNNELSITITQNQDGFKLVYSDSGEGMPNDYDFKKGGSLGMELILILTEQLRGSFSYNNDDASTFTIYFKPLEKSFSD